MGCTGPAHSLLLKQLKSGERDFEHVWLQVEDSLNSGCEHLSFLIFCIGFQTEFFEILLFCSVKRVVLLSTMRVIRYILCNWNYIMLYIEYYKNMQLQTTS